MQNVLVCVAVSNCSWLPHLRKDCASRFNKRRLVGVVWCAFEKNGISESLSFTVKYSRIFRLFYGLDTRKESVEYLLDCRLPYIGGIWFFQGCVVDNISTHPCDIKWQIPADSYHESFWPVFNCFHWRNEKISPHVPWIRRITAPFIIEFRRFYQHAPMRYYIK